MANQTSDTIPERQDHSVRKVSSWVASDHAIKSMKEALKAAEQIRLQLSGRAHSDSTELVAEDRQR
jgi:CHASE3 domain sensor protein